MNLAKAAGASACVCCFARICPVPLCPMPPPQTKNGRRTGRCDDEPPVVPVVANVVAEAARPRIRIRKK